MSKNFYNKIIADYYSSGRWPRMKEIAELVTALNGSGCKDSVGRVGDVLCRCHILEAALMERDQDVIVKASDLFLSDEYATFKHSEKCRAGKIVADLCRQGLIPLEVAPGKYRTRRYRLYDYIRSITM